MRNATSTSGQATNAQTWEGLSALPLFHAAWLFAAGIVLSSRIWLRPSLTLVAVALVAVLCAVAAYRAQRVVWLPLAVLWLLLGAWSAEMEPQPAPALALASLSDGLARTAEGVVFDAGPLRGEIEQNLDDTDNKEEPASNLPQSQASQRIDLRVSSLEVVTDSEDRLGVCRE